MSPEIPTRDSGRSFVRWYYAFFFSPLFSCNLRNKKCLLYPFVFVSSGPGRGRSPVELGETPTVPLSVCLRPLLLAWPLALSAGRQTPPAGPQNPPVGLQTFRWSSTPLVNETNVKTSAARPALFKQTNERINGKTDGQNFYQFYRTSSPTGLAALLQQR